MSQQAPLHPQQQQQQHQQYNRRSFNVLAEAFQVDPAYEYVKELGQGAYGYVRRLHHAVIG